MNKDELSKYKSATEFLLYKTANSEIKVGSAIKRSPRIYSIALYCGKH